MYLLNAWYVAAWSHEVGRGLLARTICERHILFYRKESGEAVAIGNRCAHRFAPLSRGKLIGDTVQCNYHGMRFGGDGVCVLNPHADGIIAPRMRVPAYPLVERYDMLWIWLGDAERADAALIPDFGCNTDPSFRRIEGMFEVKANYELIVDNTLDLTHAEFLHEGVLSSEAITVSKLQTEQAGTTIWSNRWCPNGDATPAWAMAFDNYDKPVDQWLYMRWDAPSTLLLDVGLAPVGRPRRDGIWQYGTDILTPKDAKTTYYFWAFARNYKIDDAGVDEFWRKSIEIAFEQQDRVMIEEQQEMIGDVDINELRPVNIAADAAAERARKLLRKLIRDQENGGVAEPRARPPLDLLKERANSASPVEPVV